jgi:DNA-binding YbaB/EbfC family protein
MADMFKMFEQFKQAQERLDQIQTALAGMTVTGTAGGGMVAVDADGRGQVRAVRLDPSVVKGEDVEMLEDLLLVAMSDAQTKATEVAQQEMAKLTGGLNLPFKLPF